MSYIVPNSTLQLFKGINLDNRYMDTVYFDNESAQNMAFSSRVFKQYNGLSYKRYTENSIKIEAQASELLGVTYMRFKNNRAGDMWFYCFVNSVDYVSETACVLTYEIDVIQTWFIQKGALNPCMVKREHTLSDSFGENLEPEGIGSDNYNINELTFYTDLTNYYIVIQTTGEPENGELLINNIFDATNKIVLPCNDTTDATYIKTALQSLLGSWDEGERQQQIIDMTMLPQSVAQLSTLPVEKDIKFDMPTSFDGYHPKNNKLWMYPFSYLTCTTKCGEGASFRWEYFEGVSPQSTNKVTFTRVCSGTGGGQMMCFPMRYNGIVKNYDCAITFSDFPKCAFTYDAYQAWVANGGKTKYENEKILTTIKGASTIAKASSNVVDYAGHTASQIGGIATAKKVDPISMASSIAAGGIRTAANVMDAGVSIAEAMNKVNYMFKDAMYEPNMTVGSASPSIAVGNRIPNFYFQHVHLKADEARRCDDFLSCYGYATNRVKVPNLKGRRYWNFVMTENCTVKGDMPASSKEAIARIFDGGITIWHNIDQIGNYNQSISEGTINNPIN